MATRRKNISLNDTEYFCNVSWTLSYNMNTKSWISFHSYIPNFYIAENNFFYSGVNGCCEEFDFLVGTLVPTPSTTTTTTTPRPTTTTTTTTEVPLDCDFNAEIVEIDCSLEGTGVIVSGDCELEGEGYIIIGNCEFDGNGEIIEPTTTTTTSTSTSTTTTTTSSTSTTTTTTTTAAPGCELEGNGAVIEPTTTSTTSTTTSTTTLPLNYGINVYECGDCLQVFGIGVVLYDPSYVIGEYYGLNDGRVGEVISTTPSATTHSVTSGPYIDCATAQSAVCI